MRIAFKTPELKQMGILKYVPWKEKIVKNVNKKHNQWCFPEDASTESMKRLMWAEAIVFSVKLLMQNHMYKFDNQIKVQTDGGSTGVTVTGVLSEIKMLKWCKVFRDTLANIGIKNELEARFVDDITLLLNELKPGTRYRNGTLVHYEEKVNEDQKTAGDKRTMEIVKSIANAIDKNIKVTYDVPSNYKDGKVPILDVKVGINEFNKIEYMFYKKPMASKHVTHKESAMSVNQKFSILTQQCFTRIHNTSEFINSDIKIAILDDFMKELKISGYNEDDRLKVLQSAINTHNKLKQKEKTDQRPYFRDKNYEKHKRKIQKLNKKNNWYRDKKDQIKTVMLVDPTPGDSLIKKLRETEQKHMIAANMRIKFVSKSGTTLLQKFQKKDPFEEACSSHDCKPCAHLNDGQRKFSNCRSNNVSYSAKCVPCDKRGKEKVYIGETSRNLYMRSVEHYNDLKRKSDRSFMLKHIKKEHVNEEQSVQFMWKVLKKFQKPLQRQIFEAKSIANTAPDVILNSKNEFHNINLQKLSMQKKANRSFQCRECSAKFDADDLLTEH